MRDLVLYGDNIVDTMLVLYRDMHACGQWGGAIIDTLLMTCMRGGGGGGGGGHNNVRMYVCMGNYYSLDGARFQAPLEEPGNELDRG